MRLLKTLRRLPDIGVDFIDTADSYGPNFSEELIKEALAPYGKIHIATKGGLTRTGPNIWVSVGRPEYLIQQAHTSRWRLGVEIIDLWQLHRIDPKVPAKEQFDAIATLIKDKVIRCAGLSEVTVAEIEAASKVFPVATVQNRYNFIDRDERGGARLLRETQHRLHSLGPARRRRVGAARLGFGRDRPQAQGEPWPDRTRLALETQPGHAADPRHRQSRASGGERRSRRDQAHGRGVRNARPRRTRGGVTQAMRAA